jgi:ParB-like chromosome segregation protein Spo0J
MTFQIADRIKELRRVKASELIPNPKNWRTHPEEQQVALRGMLKEVGYVDAIIVRDTGEGLMILDGHLRAETTPDTMVPVLEVDLTDEEADKVLATLDPLASMAGTDQDLLDDLIDSIESDEKDIEELLTDLRSSKKESRPGVERFAEDRPASMAWCLIGIPTVRFNEVNEMIEQLALDETVIVETVIGD